MGLARRAAEREDWEQTAMYFKSPVNEYIYLLPTSQLRTVLGAGFYSTIRLSRL